MMLLNLKNNLLAFYYILGSSHPYPEYSKARKLNMIEDGIIPLTDALHSCSVYLIASCEGHCSRSEKPFLSRIHSTKLITFPFHPYVYFISEPSIAFKIKVEFEKIKNKLYYKWKLNEKPKGKWVIEASSETYNGCTSDKEYLSKDINLLALAFTDLI